MLALTDRQELLRLAEEIRRIAAGAHDHRLKGFQSPELGDIADGVNRLADRAACERGLLAANIESLDASNRELRADAWFGEIVVGSPAMRRAIEVVQKVAPYDSSVLITGASGTGKKIVARIVHRESNRCRSRIRFGPLRRRSRAAARVGILRLREGRVHGCRSRQAGPVRSGRRGYALPRRGR